LLWSDAWRDEAALPIPDDDPRSEAEGMVVMGADASGEGPAGVLFSDRCLERERWVRETGGGKCDEAGAEVGMRDSERRFMLELQGAIPTPPV
jgi:hypothetical protein